MIRTRSFWKGFFGAIALVMLLSFVLIGVSHADDGAQAMTGTVRIARPPARDGTQQLCVQEDGKNMAQGGWHWVKVYLSSGGRFYRNDRVHLTRDSEGKVVGAYR